MKKKIVIVFIAMLVYRLSFAQHPLHHTMEDTITSEAGTFKMKPLQKGHYMHTGNDMTSHAYSKNLPMSRNGSGTGWNPDASPMYMWLKQTHKTDWMFHGNIFLRYTGTDIFNSGKKGSSKLSAPNWFMAMMNRRTGKSGLLNITAMLSLDRLTEGGNGYPLLFQSGETFNGKRLVDRQHPHDLFSALSIGYTQMLGKDIDIFGYIGYPGEPALGAPAFMHRVSSMNDPDAPLGHHWQDATHITFGVATVGLRYRNFKLEGSSFTGREPDEKRYDFDKSRFDSYSYRLSYNPSASWALQFSQGFIHAPEALEPGIDVTRTTASALFSNKIGHDKHVSASFIWGLNDKGKGHKEHSVLLEGNFRFGRNALFSRYEFVQKSAEELELEDELGHRAMNIHVVSAGYNRSLVQKWSTELTAGVKVTVNLPSRELTTIYGDHPVGFQVYLQIRPSLHQH
ncbi:MAG: hypothetical protein JNN00_15505 [Chitinophagaceae bacterium]|nr:hypothetical protein [Chitinophagaceae bacterium]